jgi:hypothetical protein
MEAQGRSASGIRDRGRNEKIQQDQDADPGCHACFTSVTFVCHREALELKDCSVILISKGFKTRSGLNRTPAVTGDNALEQMMLTPPYPRETVDGPTSPLEDLGGRVSHNLERLAGAVAFAALVVGGSLLLIARLGGWHHRLGEIMILSGFFGMFIRGIGGWLRKRRQS